MLYDSHIHLDQFSDDEIRSILQTPQLDSLLAVATDLASCKRLLTLKEQFPKLHIAAGFHPEQPLPSETEQAELFYWIAKNHTKLTALGEVGLPHYLKRENPKLDYTPYITLLEHFILFSKRYNLPINLHIVYEDTDIALELLSKHNINKAQFHWFKASDEMLEKLLNTPYFVSLTPDILHNPKTQRVAEYFPLERLLIETDAPWQYKGFNRVDIVEQLLAVVKKIAEIKSMPVEKIETQLYNNFLQLITT
ncbi:deoxyribonuclease [Mannheimia granulomatis]|uniref:TatD family hydrolase n=1 Tax=Mannheimia granulomatis TaxID=85402 RepID=UPI00159DAB74|nr:TatD family hydrolase [Mannheimia granulomatis]QLB15143.1 deoxyribonuclease [Mannheimia granulomatis]